jgi:hypothetical protein
MMYMGSDVKICIRFLYDFGVCEGCGVLKAGKGRGYGNLGDGLAV